MSAARRPPLHKRAFGRVFLFGVVLLASVVGASVAVFHLVFEPPPFHRGPAALGRLVETMADGTSADPTRLQQGLEQVQLIVQTGVATYRVDGTRLAAAGASPPPPLTAEQGRALDEFDMIHRQGGAVMAVPLTLPDGGPAYLLVAAGDMEPASRATALILTILGVLLLVSLFAARRLVRPLEQLTGTAGQLAEGDLSVRTGMTRKDEVGQLARTMDEMAERLEHRIRSEKELLANISHEIRTPLARIRVALELCEDERATIGELREKLNGIQGDATELEQLIDDVLVASRLDLAQTAASDQAGGSIALRPEPTDLASIVDKAARRFSAVHPEHTLAREVSADLPQLTADPALLRRVIDNLLDNAAKYCDPDQPIEVPASVEGEAMRVEVRDRGIGVPEEDLHRLFEPFFRTDRSRSREAGGTGLGLALCMRIVQAHGGSIEAMRRADGGTAIRLDLPLS